MNIDHLDCIDEEEVVGSYRSSFEFVGEEDSAILQFRISKVRLGRKVKAKGLTIKSIPWHSFSTEADVERFSESVDLKFRGIPRNYKYKESSCHEVTKKELDLVLEPKESWERYESNSHKTIAMRAKLLGVSVEDLIGRKDLQGEGFVPDQTKVERGSGVKRLGGGIYESRVMIDDGFTKKRRYNGRYLSYEAAKAASAYAKAGHEVPRDFPGRIRVGSKAGHPYRMTDQDIRDIRRLHKEGASVYELSLKYCRAKERIYEIINRTTYAYVEDEAPNGTDGHQSDDHPREHEEGSGAEPEGLLQDHLGSAASDQGDEDHPNWSGREDVCLVPGSEGLFTLCGQPMPRKKRSRGQLLPRLRNQATPVNGSGNSESWSQGLLFPE